MELQELIHMYKCMVYDFMSAGGDSKLGWASLLLEVSKE